MANLNDLPPGLWLHFSEEREDYCKLCNGTGMAGGRVGYSGAIGNHCAPCHGTGRRRIRVTGAVEVNWGTHYISDNNIEVRWNYIGLTTFGSLKELLNDVVTAFLTDELPDEIAKYIEREEL